MDNPACLTPEHGEDLRRRDRGHRVQGVPLGQGGPDSGLRDMRRDVQDRIRRLHRVGPTGSRQGALGPAFKHVRNPRGGPLQRGARGFCGGKGQGDPRRTGMRVVRRGGGLREVPKLRALEPGVGGHAAPFCVQVPAGGGNGDTRRGRGSFKKSVFDPLPRGSGRDGGKRRRPGKSPDDGVRRLRANRGRVVPIQDEPELRSVPTAFAMYIRPYTMATGIASTMFRMKMDDVTMAMKRMNVRSPTTRSVHPGFEDLSL